MFCVRSHREELLTKLQEETLQTIQETVGRDVREILMEHTQQLSEMSAIDRSRQADPMQQQVWSSELFVRLADVIVVMFIIIIIG